MARKRTDYSARYKRLPKKGTKRRELLIQLLSKSGISAYEAAVYDLIAMGKNFNSYMEVLHNEQGWDIIIFKRPSQRPGTHTNELVYRIAGRFRPDGTYRDYTRWTLP